MLFRHKGTAGSKRRNAFSGHSRRSAANPGIMLIWREPSKLLDRLNATWGTLKLRSRFMEKQFPFAGANQMCSPLRTRFDTSATFSESLASSTRPNHNYREALAIYRDHPEADALDLANAIRGLAVLTFDTGGDEEAKALWQEALNLYGSVSVQSGVNESSRRLALLASR